MKDKYFEWVLWAVKWRTSSNLKPFHRPHILHMNVLTLQKSNSIRRHPWVIHLSPKLTLTFIEPLQYQCYTLYTSVSHICLAQQEVVKRTLLMVVGTPYIILWWSTCKHRSRQTSKLRWCNIIKVYNTDYIPELSNTSRSFPNAILPITVLLRICINIQDKCQIRCATSSRSINTPCSPVMATSIWWIQSCKGYYCWWW